MFIIKVILILIIQNYLNDATSTTHYLVQDGKIQAQIDSPYHLRRPHDLIAFLNQNKCKDRIDELFEELMSIKKDLMAKMNHIDKFTADFMNQYQTKCVANYYLKVEDLYSTVTSNRYFQRLNFPGWPKFTEKDDLKLNKKPRCGEVLPLKYSMFCFDHLEGVRNRKNYTMEEENLLNIVELGISEESFPRKLHYALKKDPKNWKYHILGSFYWRLQGDANQAIECARRAIYLSPRKFKDIPLLSLGTILQRIQIPIDAVTVLLAAVEHSPLVPENQFALANSLFMISEFDRSLECYDFAKSLDDSYSSRVDFIKKSLNCFKYVKKRLINMEGVLDEMFVELEKFAARKTELEECHDKLIKEQVPLGSRFNESPHHVQNDHLTHRSQYCSTRIDEDTTEPVLFCDFFSDIQMRMKLKVVAIDLINNYVERTNDLIKRHLESSLGVFKFLDLDKITDVGVEALH